MTKLPNLNAKRGFTLIELLVVIGILTILLAIVLIAINPARQFAQANNTQRRSDVNAILNAVHQYAADHNGTLPALITSTEKQICTPVATCAPSPPLAAVSDAVDLCEAANADLVFTYLADLPLDPTVGTTNAINAETCADLVAGEFYNTGYTIQQIGTTGRTTVRARSAEAEGATTPTIQVTR